MSSNKSRDLAKEFVDFLLTDDEKKSSTAQKTTMISADEVKTSQLQADVYDNDRTIQLDTNPQHIPALELDFGLPQEAAQLPTRVEEQTKQEQTKQLSSAEPVAVPAHDNAIEFDFGDLKNESVQKVVQINSSSTQVGETKTLAGHAEALRVQQGRIQQLEIERDQLRTQVEQLLTTSETLQRRLAETRAQLESSQRSTQQRLEILEEEKLVLRSRLQARDKDASELKSENEELNNRFQTDLRKVRVRERELENRLEIMRAEQSAVLRAKDESILTHKRQIDQLNFEIENYRHKTSELGQVIKDNHDKNHRVVKALRLALSVLEGADLVEERPATLKKVSG